MNSLPSHGTKWGRRARHTVILTALLAVLLILAACMGSGSAQSTEAGYQPISLSDFPVELGRGFPLAQEVERGGAEVGDEAPNFAFVLDDGRGADLHSLRGRPVVLNFWATWCGPCRAEMPEFVALAEGEDEIVVLEVNVQESMEVIEPFAQDFSMSMPVIQDPPGSIRTAYGVRNMPTTLFINRDGTIHARWAGLLVSTQLDQFVDELLTE